MINTIQGLKQCNKNYFTKENKRFFNDIEYKVLKAKKSKTMYLVTLTAKFSDMFDGIKKYVYTIKPITETGSILSFQFSDNGELKTFNNEFISLTDVKEYLKGV